MRSARDTIYDQWLVLRFQQGESGAAEELVTRWNGRLLFYLRRITRDEAAAWDAVQETWVAVLRKLHRLRDPQALPAWLYTVARRIALSQNGTPEKSLDRADRCCEVHLPSSNFAPDRDELDTLRAAIDQLSTPHREAVTLFFLRDLSIAEMARVTGTSPGTLKSRIFYAKRILRTLLTAQGVTP